MCKSYWDQSGKKSTQELLGLKWEEKYAQTKKIFGLVVIMWMKRSKSIGGKASHKLVVINRSDWQVVKNNNMMCCKSCRVYTRSEFFKKKKFVLDANN